MNFSDAKVGMCVTIVDSIPRKSHDGLHEFLSFSSTSVGKKGEIHCLFEKDEYDRIDVGVKLTVNGHTYVDYGNTNDIEPIE